MEQLKAKPFIYKYGDFTEDDDIIKVTTEQIDQMENFKPKIEFKMTGRTGNHEFRTWAFQVDMKSKKVDMKWERLNVREFLHSLQYDKCYKFCYLDKYCKGNVIWSNCGRKDHDNVSRKNDKCNNNYIIFNTKFNMNFYANNMWNKQCEIYCKELDNICKWINYGISI